MPLRLLRTEYASVVSPIVKFIDDLRQRKEEQIMVLVPVAVPHRIRYLFLHNHIDVVLDRALRGRTDVVIARVQVPLYAAPGDEVGENQAAEDGGETPPDDAIQAEIPVSGEPGANLPSDTGEGNSDAPSG